MAIWTWKINASSACPPLCPSSSLSQHEFNCDILIDTFSHEHTAVVQCGKPFNRNHFRFPAIVHKGKLQRRLQQRVLFIFLMYDYNTNENVHWVSEWIIGKVWTCALWCDVVIDFLREILTHRTNQYIRTFKYYSLCLRLQFQDNIVENKMFYFCPRFRRILTQFSMHFFSLF